MTGLRRFEIYGVTMASDFPFVSHLLPGTRDADLSFARVAAPPVEIAECGPPVAGRPGWFLFYAGAEWDVLHFPDEADFFLRSDRIECHVPDEGSATMVEIRLLGGTFSLWLERQGILALHASAVLVGDHAIAFTAGNGSGKSSLAATFMQAGFPLLSDDILPIEIGDGQVLARPGYPQMRLWPREARHFLGSDEDLGLVHPEYSKLRVPVRPDLFGAFCAVTVPLAAIYFLHEQRSGLDPLVAIDAPPSRDAVFELMGGSFAAAAARGLGNPAERLRRSSSIVSQVAMHHLRYDRRLEHLPQVRDAVLAHVGGVP